MRKGVAPMRCLRALLNLTLLCSLFAWACLPAYADTTGALSGRVLNFRAEHAPIPGVRVSAIARDAEYTAITDERGFFAFVSLPPGVYKITMDKLGYAGQFGGNVCVPAGEHPFMRLFLRSGLWTPARVVERPPNTQNMGVRADLYDSTCMNTNQLQRFPGASSLVPFF